LNFVRAEVKAGGAVKLSWAVAYDGEGNPIGSTDNEEGIGLKKYQVLRKKVGTDIWRVVADSVAPNTLTYTDNQNLQWGSAYIYKVNVYDFLNNVQENSPLRQVFVDARNELVLDELNEFTASPQTTLRWHW